MRNRYSAYLRRRKVSVAGLFGPLLLIRKPLLIVCALILCCLDCAPGRAIHEGDIIFQSLSSTEGRAIELATRSGYSHTGIIFRRGEGFYVLEALNTVRYTPLEEWIERGGDSGYVVKRLREAGTGLTPENLKRLRALAEEFRGRAYDLFFRWSDERVYCSELVWKLYKRAMGIELGRPRRLGQLRLDDALVREKLAQRYGSEVPLEETVISPGDIFRSERLVTVRACDGP